MTDYQRIERLFKDVWSTAKNTESDLQEEITVTAKVSELLNLLEERGLFVEEGRLLSIGDSSPGILRR